MASPKPSSQHPRQRFHLKTPATGLIYAVTEGLLESAAKTGVTRGRHLAGLVSAEAALTGLAGGAAGLVFGLVALFGFAISQGWQPVFDIRLAPVAVLAGAFLAIVSSVIGATRAARLSPGAALRA